MGATTTMGMSEGSFKLYPKRRQTPESRAAISASAGTTEKITGRKSNATAARDCIGADFIT
jgi:hypothetical protein